MGPIGKHADTQTVWPDAEMVNVDRNISGSTEKLRHKPTLNRSKDNCLMVQKTTLLPMSRARKQFWTIRRFRRRMRDQTDVKQLTEDERDTCHGNRISKKPNYTKTMAQERSPLGLRGFVPPGEIQRTTKFVTIEFFASLKFN